MAFTSFKYFKIIFCLYPSNLFVHYSISTLENSEIPQSTQMSSLFLHESPPILSQHCIDGLSHLSNCSDVEIQRVCKYFLQMLVAQRSNIKIGPDKDDALCSLATLLSEVTKNHSSIEQLRSTLSDHGVSDSTTTVLLDLYSQHKDILLKYVETSGISCWEVVDLDWRIDFALRSKHGGRENYPVYLLSLKVVDRGLPRKIDMIASEEEMQDLLSKVRDAVKQADRVMTSIPDI